MARISTVSPEEASGDQKPFFEAVKRQYGGIVPGILQILLVDPKVSEAALGIYQHLHLRADSSMTRLQREMLATVVNGAVGGAP